MNNDNNGNENLFRQVKDELDAGLDRLDPSITNRLRESRRKAVAQPANSPFPGFHFMRLLPLTGVAMAIVLVMAVSLWYTMRPSMTENKTEDIEMLTAQGNLDMYRELDFYKWLAETNETP
jgi:hypothetical protein